MNKLPISAMVVGFNEERFLSRCFESISFCDEIVYTDLGSTDRSKDIARKYASQIYERRKVPSCEMIQAEVVNYLKNDWVLFIDPDERVDPTLADELCQKFPGFSGDLLLGAVTVPWQFYFKNKILNGTRWGGINKKYLLVNKNRFLFKPVVHYGRKLMDGYEEQQIDYNGGNVLHHYWMNSYTVFMKKHIRYLRNEGKDRFNIGVRTSLKKLITVPYRAFYDSYKIQHGYKDGFIGFVLSIFWAFYESVVSVSLYLIQHSSKKKSANG